MKLKNKILLISFLLLIFILFLNTNNVFASYDFTYNNVNYSLPDLPDYDYYFICDFNEDMYIAYCSNSPLILGQTTSYYVETNPSGSTVYSYKYVKNGDFEFVRANYSSRFDLASGISSIINTSHDLYCGETLVFQRPVADKSVIPALETAEEVPKAMVQTLKILIPVGLIVLGIGLAIYLIKRVLSLTK